MFLAIIAGPSAEIRQMLRNCVKNRNILADCSAQLELLPFSLVDMAEEMPLWFCLQHEIEEIRGAQILI